MKLLDIFNFQYLEVAKYLLERELAGLYLNNTHTRKTRRDNHLFFNKQEKLSYFLDSGQYIIQPSEGNLFLSGGFLYNSIYL
jgi:hypothetical protein